MDISREDNIRQMAYKYDGLPTLVIEMLVHGKTSPEHPIYHPEGNLYAHIDIVVGRAMETDSKELHFAALLHDICKHGHNTCLGYERRTGRLKTLPEGTYWQNTQHDRQSVEFCDLPVITKWMESHEVNVSMVKTLVGNHMRMKTFLGGKAGRRNGMGKPKRDRMQKALEAKGCWKELVFFSTYCDSMLTEQGTVKLKK
jgi:hypothetical protein